MFPPCPGGAGGAGRGGAVKKRARTGRGVVMAAEAAEAAEGRLMRRYEGAAQGRGVAADGWRVCLAHSFEELRQPYGAGDVPLRDVLRHVGLGLRYGRG